MSKFLKVLVLSSISFSLVVAPVFANATMMMEETEQSATVSTNSGNSEKLSNLKDKIRENKQKRLDELTKLKKERKTAAEARLEESKQLICERITTNVDNIIANFERVHQNQVMRYNSIKQSLVNANERLTDLGYDTTQLQSKFATLDQYILEYDALQKTLQDLVNKVAVEGCSAEGSYKTAIQNVNNALKDMRVQADKIFSYYRDEIKPLLLALKDSQPSQS
jgi:hypothetical protein